MMIRRDLSFKQQFMQEQGFKTSKLRVFMSDGTSANILYRLTSWLVAIKLSPIAFFTITLNKWLNGCVIGAGAKFGGGLILMHPVGIVVNSKVVGGERIVIESGVVIGDEKGKAPRLGNNIFIGSGAKIIGDVHIGDNVKVGANAVVVKSVPDNATVVGIPAREITRKPA